MFVLKEADIMPDHSCGFKAKAETKEEVMKMMMDHGMEAHQEEMDKMNEGKSEEEKKQAMDEMMKLAESKIIEE